MIDCGIIPDLVKAIDSDTHEVKKEACWAISNATSEGTREQIRSLVAQQCLRALIAILKDSTDSRLIIVGLEGIGASSTTALSMHTLPYSLHLRVLAVSLPAFFTHRFWLLPPAENILRSGRSAHSGECQSNEYVKIVDGLGGLDALERLQTHDHQGIYEKAYQLLREYFDITEGDTEESE